MRDIQFLQAPRRLPWKDWEEWQQVHRNAVTSASAASELVLQLKQVGGAPASVTMTFQTQAAVEALSNEASRMALSMVLVRAVNLL